MPGTAFRHSPAYWKRGASADGTLAYEWYAQRDHSRVVQAWLWTGSTWDKVIDDHVAAPK
ncbi:hypothetical protein [Sphingomonas jatrophae]|uniref:hypothetical protein n=1 Tax=Sphingomonas jatrophae TaxID=1166337 RepID=UPI000D08B1BD|nr:hypothetical protein [Sphingomonas jatrophae]